MYCEFVFKCILRSILGCLKLFQSKNSKSVPYTTVYMTPNSLKPCCSRRRIFLNHIIILRFPLAAYGWVSEGWKVIVRHKSVCERTCDPRDRICINYNNSTRNAFCWIRSVKIKLNIRLVYYFSQVSSTSNTPSVRRRRPRGHRRSPNLLKLRTVCLFNL